MFFFLILPPPPRSTLFPYTTLFRSLHHAQRRQRQPGAVRVDEESRPPDRPELVGEARQALELEASVRALQRPAGHAVAAALERLGGHQMAEAREVQRHLTDAKRRGVLQ